MLEKSFNIPHFNGATFYQLSNIEDSNSLNRNLLVS